MYSRESVRKNLRRLDRVADPECDKSQEVLSQ